MTSSAKIYRPEHIVTLENPTEEDIKSALAENSVIMRGKDHGGRKADGSGH